jgi:glucose-6-phosphate isomerase
VNNFFATFIEVLRDRARRGPTVEPHVTSGDYLSAFLQGTRQALYESHRGSITITVPEVTAGTLGGLIALYERAVGFYAGLVNINAYHQPGVQAGKVAATSVLELQARVLDHLHAARRPETADQIAAALGVDEVETVFRILQHAAANLDHRVGCKPDKSPFDVRYYATRR